MLLKPQKYFSSARRLLGNTMATGRTWVSKVDSAISEGMNIYAQAKPIFAQAAEMHGGAQPKQMLGTAARGIESAAGRYGHMRGEIDRAGALMNRLGNVSAY